MMTCSSCGGVIGRDCFNPSECAEITRQMAENGRNDLREENERLKSAIRWALGETDFRGRHEGEQGAYYWRKELRERSGLDWESSPNNPKNQPPVQP
jgi:hypothetical protein